MKLKPFSAAAKYRWSKIHIKNFSPHQFKHDSFENFLFWYVLTSFIDSNAIASSISSSGRSVPVFERNFNKLLETWNYKKLLKKHFRELFSQKFPGNVRLLSKSCFPGGQEKFVFFKNISSIFLPKRPMVFNLLEIFHGHGMCKTFPHLSFEANKHHRSGLLAVKLMTWPDLVHHRRSPSTFLLLLWKVVGRWKCTENLIFFPDIFRNI